ncbi:MAG: SPOR domain-containing protein [Parvularculaceae bacterium]|nr:SPOR domain-containing protein [Parvularculaceae bacterium]
MGRTAPALGVSAATFKPKRRAGTAALLCCSWLGLSACAALEKEIGLEAAPKAAAPDPLEMRIASLESALAAAQRDKAALEQKLAALEKAARAEEAPVVAPPTLKEPQTAVSVEVAPALQQPPEISPETVVAAADADLALAAAPTAPVETSPRLVQPTFASQETLFENEASDGIKTASVLFGVHLASYRHAEEARAGWVKLQRDYPDQLGLLEPRLERVELEGRGTFLRLIGGGFAAEEKAVALCAALKSLGAYCAVSSFEGERLSFAGLKSG